MREDKYNIKMKREERNEVNILYSNYNGKPS